jgi:hypothetical protein
MKYLHVIASGQAQHSGMMQNSRVPRFCFIRKKWHRKHVVHSSLRGCIRVKVTGLVMETKVLWKLFYPCSDIPHKILATPLIYSWYPQHSGDYSLVSRTKTWFLIPSVLIFKLTHILPHPPREVTVTAKLGSVLETVKVSLVLTFAFTWWPTRDQR